MFADHPIHWGLVAAGVLALVVCVYLWVHVGPVAAGEALILVTVPVGGLVVGLVGAGFTGQLGLSIVVGCAVGLLLVPVVAALEG